jgi:hypothetical protein
MADIPRASAVRGKTIRYVWTEGPTKGKTYEHVFHEDGTVEWHEVGGGTPSAGGSAKSDASGGNPHAPERVPYAAMEAAKNVYAVSYLATSGYTLTVVLDFTTSRMVGIASGGTTWVPVQGRFELMT